MDKKQTAINLFHQGFSCAPAVLSAYAGELGLEPQIAAKIACPFGGGFARQGETCGAVTGAFMVIGLKYGMEQFKNQHEKEKTYQLVQEFITRFKAQNGSITCRDLLGYDISTPEKAKLVHDQGVFSSICDKLVGNAIEILEEIL